MRLVHSHGIVRCNRINRIKDRRAREPYQKMHETSTTTRPVKESELSELRENTIPPHNFVLRLAAVSTSEDAEILAERILKQRGENLIIDTGDVERFDTPCVEVLIAASRLWSADGFSIELGSLSNPFESCLGALGIARYNLETGRE